MLPINELFDKKLTRKEFLVTFVVMAVTFVGIAGIIREFLGFDIKDNLPSSVRTKTSFGSGPYGI